MECLRMRQSYSFIGNLTDFLISNEQRIKNLMVDYEIQSKVDTLQDGREVKSLFFTKQNVSVRFTPSRVDYNYAYPNANISTEEVYRSAQEFFALLAEIFPEITAQRIAIVSQGFIKNENCSAIEDFTSKMGFATTFGECNELTFKINNPVTRFEPLNSVLNVDMGEAKNNKTQAVMKVLLVSVDVNTLAANAQPRFTPDKFDLYFKELQEEVEAKHAAIEKY